MKRKESQDQIENKRLLYFQNDGRKRLNTTCEIEAEVYPTRTATRHKSNDPLQFRGVSASRSSLRVQVFPVSFFQGWP